MAVPTITPLPTPPDRTSAAAEFTEQADEFLGALPDFQAEANQLAAFVDDRATTADARATAAAGSATAAANSAAQATTNGAAQVALAAEQVTLANGHAGRAEDARADAQSFAAAAGAAAGLPAIDGKAGRALKVKADSSGVEWSDAGPIIGDLLWTARDPGPTFLPARGGIYLQSAYPDLLSALGLIGERIGTEWSPIATGTGTYSAVDTDGEGVWVAAANGAIPFRRSTDNGMTFSPLALPAGQYLSIASGSAGVWVAVGATGLAARSTDNGATWAALPTMGSGLLRVATNGAGGWLAVDTNRQVYRSVNNGATFSLLSTIPGTAHPIAIAHGDGAWMVVTTGGSVVLRSLDFGATWVALSHKFGAAIEGHRGVAFGGGVWVAWALGSISRSTDNGDTWGTLVPASDIRAVAPYGARGWLGLGYNGMRMVSMDAGASWAAGPGGPLGWGVYGLRCDNDGTFVAVGDGGRISRSILAYPYDKNTQFMVPYVDSPQGITSYIKALEAA